MLIKICGLRRQIDVDAAAHNGANFCGFIFYPKSPRHIEPGAARILRSYKMLRVGVFVTDNINYILDTMEIAKLDYIQLHGNQGIDCARKIGADKVIRVLWPEKYSSTAELGEEAQNFASSSAMYLLDSGLGGGGSGKCFRWKNLGDLRLPKPWLLAGGLDSRNIPIAIKECKPHGLDLNSGVEDSPGIKNTQKIISCLKSAYCKGSAVRDNTESSINMTDTTN